MYSSGAKSLAGSWKHMQSSSSEGAHTGPLPAPRSYMCLPDLLCPLPKIGACFDAITQLNASITRERQSGVE
jgi:hypothetical protein